MSADETTTKQPRRGGGALAAMRATITLRVEQDLADGLNEVAILEGVSISEICRRAVGGYLETTRRDPEFRRRVAERAERVRGLLETAGGA